MLKSFARVCICRHFDKNKIFSELSVLKPFCDIFILHEQEAFIFLRFILTSLWLTHKSNTNICIFKKNHIVSLCGRKYVHLYVGVKIEWIEHDNKFIHKSITVIHVVIHSCYNLHFVNKFVFQNTPPFGRS